jgi:hypothetical protein
VRPAPPAVPGHHAGSAAAIAATGTCESPGATGSGSPRSDALEGGPSVGDPAAAKGLLSATGRASGGVPPSRDRQGSSARRGRRRRRAEVARPARNRCRMTPSEREPVAGRIRAVRRPAMVGLRSRQAASNAVSDPPPRWVWGSAADGTASEPFFSAHGERALDSVAPEVDGGGAAAGPTFVSRGTADEGDRLPVRTTFGRREANRAWTALVIQARRPTECRARSMARGPRRQAAAGVAVASALRSPGDDRQPPHPESPP